MTVIHAQVPVIISIDGIDDSSPVYFSYTDPQTSQAIVRSRTCNFDAVEPYSTLFALDYSSSRNGWQFQPPVGSPPPSPVVSADALSLHVVDGNASSVYDFTLIFYNTATQKNTQSDPQEGNLTPPTNRPTP